MHACRLSNVNSYYYILASCLRFFDGPNFQISFKHAQSDRVQEYGIERELRLSSMHLWLQLLVAVQFLTIINVVYDCMVCYIYYTHKNLIISSQNCIFRMIGSPLEGGRVMRIINNVIIII
jgi:hypothetical protein